MADRVFAIEGDWAVASDGVQWMLCRRHPRKRGDTWDPVSFVRSSRDVLARCMRENGVMDGTAVFLLSGLPDTFDQWEALHRSKDAVLPMPSPGEAAIDELAGTIPAPDQLDASCHAPARTQMVF